MTSPKLLVHRLVFLWIATWLLQSLLGLASTPLGGLFRLDAGAVLAASFWDFPGVLLYSLGHAPFPDLFHLLFNAWLMWVFGPEVEALFRGKKLIRLFAVSVLFSAGFRLFLGGTLGGVFLVPALGGSGLVMTVIAVQAAVYPNRSISLLLFSCPLRTFFSVLVVLDVLGFLYSVFERGGAAFAYDIHLSGAALGWFWAGGHFQAPDFWRRWKIRKKEAHLLSELKKNSAKEAELDRILAKVSQSGLGSLSAQERQFLERRSGRSR